MTDRKATLVAILQDQVSGTAKKISAEISGIGESVGKVNAVLQGIGQGIGQELFRGLSDAIGTAARAIPDLLDQGNSYLEQLHQIQLETGMTAEQASLLTGTMKNLGVPMDALDTLYARLGKNLGTNEGLFRQLGVATRDSNGEMLGAYQIVENLRQAVNAHGESLLSTAAAQQLFGRSAYELLPYLQATSGALKTASDNVRGFGGIFTQAAIDGATALGRTLTSLRDGLVDIGGQIAGAIDPYLQAFVQNLSDFVKANLQQIVNFAVGVTNTILGFISGLFGMTDALNTTTPVIDQNAGAADKAAAATAAWLKGIVAGASGTDAFSTAINSQIKAIDAHATAFAAAAEKRRAATERVRLSESLSAAQAQLKDLRGADPFLGGLSAAEQALAVQKHAQDVLNAEKDVRDKRQALGNFEADQKDRAEAELASREKLRLQDNLAAHKAADQAILSSGLQMNNVLGSAAGDTFKNIGLNLQQLGKTAAASFKGGVDAAKGFLDILLGVEQTASDRGEHTFRTGGVIGALGEVGRAFWDVGQTLVNLVAWISSNWQNITSAFSSNPLFGGFKFFPTDGKIGQHAAGGWVGLHGPEIALLGERGPEYVLSNRQLGQLGGSTRPVELHLTIEGAKLDGRQITETVSRIMALDLSQSPVSSLPSGSF